MGRPQEPQPSKPHPSGEDAAPSSGSDAPAARKAVPRPTPKAKAASQENGGADAGKNPPKLEKKPLGGRFRLDRLLARGGMGSIWAGWDLDLERPVAVKFMDPAIGRNAELRSRFKREAKAAARLRTPHVVEIYERALDGDTPYIVMELLDGEDLGERLGRLGRVPLGQAAAIFVQTAKALRHAHQAGVVHRDLKPHNIFLCKGDPEELVKVLDFGIARLVDKEQSCPTRTGEVLGSPHYMSPEQARGLKTLDHRSDLWSLAGVMYHAVTGHRPFGEGGIGDVIFKICAGKVDPPSAVAPDLPKEPDAFFEKAFQLEPDKRHQSAAELAHAFLEAVASHIDGLPAALRYSAQGAIDSIPSLASGALLGALADAPVVKEAPPAQPASGEAQAPSGERAPSVEPAAPSEAAPAPEGTLAGASGDRPAPRRARKLRPLWGAVAGAAVAAGGLSAALLLGPAHRATPGAAGSARARTAVAPAPASAASVAAPAASTAVPSASAASASSAAAPPAAVPAASASPPPAKARPGSAVKGARKGKGEPDWGY
ncbi:MAG: serine/threonine protein kinase [Deltaproteobacteria bacterium]|nr:serine/threonine protein kinase [Deltaproteobacteria bacterium]